MESETIEWVTSNFLPFEAELRRQLRRVCAGPAEIDDVIQEAYYKVLTMADLEHVRQPKAFLLTMARNIVLMRMRRDAIVHIEAVANLEDLNIEDSAATPERLVMARAELKWVLGLMANLPGRCRDIFHARRIDGLSQQETARSFGISESVVEKETVKGIKLIQKMIAEVGIDDLQAPASSTRQQTAARTHHAHD